MSSSFSSEKHTAEFNNATAAVHGNRQALGCAIVAHRRGECACCHRVGELRLIPDGHGVIQVCQPCREATIVWSDACGHRLTSGEVESIMTRLVLTGHGFPSIAALIRQAIADRLIARGSLG